MDLWITQEQLDALNVPMIVGEEMFIPAMNQMGLRKGRYRIVQPFPEHGLAEIALITQSSPVPIHFLY